MLQLLTLPIQLLQIVFYAFRGLLDALKGRERLRTEFTVLINAPRAIVWRLNTVHHLVLPGPPIMEIWQEALPENPDLWLTRVAVNGQPRVQSVSRKLEEDEIKGVVRTQSVDHALSIPPGRGRDVETRASVEATPAGTKFTMSADLMVRAFQDRIAYPLGVCRMAQQMKQRCEEEAGTFSQLAALANHSLPLSVVALLSFCYLFGWKFGLLLAVVVILHEAGHVVAMLVTGVGVRGIYLIPFFGGAAVPKNAYRTEGRLGFIAFMGPGASLIPTLALLAAYRTNGGLFLRQAVEMFAVINAANLLPIYPLDGGLILNALIGSVSRTSALIVSWVGVLTGLCLAAYLNSFLIGIPFLLFALQRYLTNTKTIELERLSLAQGIALAVASIATFVIYAIVIKTTWMVHPARI
jgi:Zn-dependent protease